MAEQIGMKKEQEVRRYLWHDYLTPVAVENIRNIGTAMAINEKIILIGFSYFDLEKYTQSFSAYAPFSAACEQFPSQTFIRFRQQNF